MSAVRLWAAVLAATAVLAAGCGVDTRVPVTTMPPAVQPQPPGAHPVTDFGAVDNGCDVEASLRPGPQPQPGAMPPNSVMARILAKGRLTVGVDQNTYLFGYRNPSTGQLQGFDIDLAREIARDLFGDPNKVELRSVSTAGRVPALQKGQVDLVVRTFSVTCDRRRDVDFSSVYYRAPQRILVPSGSGIRSNADLAGKRVCVTFGSDSTAPLLAMQNPPIVQGVDNWTDCLVELQQGQVDAVRTDEAILAGLAAQDPNLQLIGDAMGFEPYAVGVPKGEPEFVRFVNGVLDRIRGDGTWQRMYAANLTPLGPSPGPPAARYSD
ncbi:glutamate ABC transporter substrate-binding protein [Nocardia sp. alder85J]|uniref:glutamate ABC transporter substrate-binding protein n=1 Tax=Nocardia sp. alder85J TaxID=2862949 RepID=UPI001CD1BE19|nr:glutamate ABC transporter substrate-binding protein [Nocardia sp. alder85J]MCX4093270.1 glutamate ABC transporter substrate-binding protein [Nocardia sp. alder85J]